MEFFWTINWWGSRTVRRLWRDGFYCFYRWSICINFFAPIDGECVFDGTETFSYEVSGNSITLAFLEEGEDYTETLGFSIDGFELTLTLEEEGEVEEEIFTRMTEVE